MSLTALKECPNCSATLEGTDKFCPNCGQTTSIHRFNLPHIFHEIFHAFTHADKGVLLLLKELAIRPGIVAREYILEGKRKKYFNPFTFLLLMVGLTLLVNSVFHPYTDRTQNLVKRAEAKQYRSEEMRQRMIGYAERQQNMQTFIEKKNNLIIFLSIPLMAFIFWLFFLRSGVNYAEHLVAQVFFTGFYALVVFVLLTPLLKTIPGFWRIQLLLHVVYLTIAYYRFLPGTRSFGLLKTLGASLLALMTWMVFSFGVGFLYIRYGG
ncbi:DUF3667 domain-containing protein [Larkinella terrae]|uniref:DUF3667 domain-containing protein n=1 Tax=Larkinella terrae TaxID=2025311 RepID=A0A7K0ED90_9BACT|nr:DUF3667 domain-containing protein [Larkinella terrae]MRS59847.1 DUF3667 domain-containing protein [Larkinella terrae]